MIDIHSHILPGVDDGAKTLEDALQLLRMAVADGVTTQVLTPHIRPTRYINDPRHIRAVFSEFVQTVREHDIPINLHLSAEVRIGPEVMMLLQRDDFPWLGSWEGKRAFLLEFPFQNIPFGSLNLVEWLIDRDILPIIAHPERNREIQQNMEKLVPFIEAGCITQLTGASLSGKFGQEAKQSATDLLQAGHVTVMATDTHNATHRPPDLKSSLEMAAEIIGEEKAYTLVYDVPAQLLNLQHDNVVAPNRFALSTSTHA